MILLNNSYTLSENEKNNKKKYFKFSKKGYGCK